MNFTQPSLNGLDEQTAQFYRRVLRVLGETGVPFLVGGAYALHHYTGVIRHTKDLDVFVAPGDAGRLLGALAAAGYRTERTFPHWLGKAFCGDAFIDVIYSSGNGVAEVDAGWFEHAEGGEVLGVPVRFTPAEEMIWSKSFVLERERFDGADIAHLLRARGPRLDWDRLLARFGPYWRVLLCHLVLFGFVYPGRQSVIPARTLDELLGRLAGERANPPADADLCQGTLLSREQYLIDIDQWGFRDARLRPAGKMTPQAVSQWTEAIGTKP
jgi:hypothetical protein